MCLPCTPGERTPGMYIQSLAMLLPSDITQANSPYLTSLSTPRIPDYRPLPPPLPLLLSPLLLPPSSSYSEATTRWLAGCAAPSSTKPCTTPSRQSVPIQWILIPIPAAVALLNSTSKPCQGSALGASMSKSPSNDPTRVRTKLTANC